MGDHWIARGAEATVGDDDHGQAMALGDPDGLGFHRAGVAIDEDARAVILITGFGRGHRSSYLGFNNHEQTNIKRVVSVEEEMDCHWTFWDPRKRKAPAGYAPAPDDP
jgi:hypothetical protein